MRPEDDAELLRYSFSIVGAQKSGTSSLSQALNWHPHVLRAPRKELRFFSDPTIDWTDPPYDEHRARRTRPTQRVVGDASVSYLWWPGALARMHDYNPGMRLVAVLRDPVERAFSQWVMARGRNPDSPDWPEVVAAHLDQPLPTEEPGSGRARGLASAFSRGLYAEQLARGHRAFPRDQWLVLEFRSMLADFAPTVDAVTDHIGIRRFRRVRPAPHAMAGPRVSGTPPTGAQVHAAAQRYAGDLARLPDLSGLDVGHWPTVRVLAGTLDPEELAQDLGRKVDAASSR